MKTDKILQVELDTTNDKIKNIEGETFDGTPVEKLVSHMDFNQKKLESLRSVRDVLEWTLADTDLDLNAWGKMKYKMSNANH